MQAQHFSHFYLLKDLKTIYDFFFTFITEHFFVWGYLKKAL